MNFNFKKCGVTDLTYKRAKKEDKKTEIHLVNNE